MQLLTPADAAGRVTAALKNAASATGAGFDYLLRTAKRESALNPAAQAPTSSARGLFQFIDQTWLEVLKQDGAQLGLGDAAADVTRNASGRYVVADPARRAEILAMRDDPQAAALLAGAFTKRNAATLESAIGRSASEGELYAAHFLGARGAADLISLASATPAAPAADAFPAQAAANRAIFFDGARARSAAEVYARLTTSKDVAPVASPRMTVAAYAAQPAGDGYGPFNGGVETDGTAFHSLFKTGRRSPVSAYVAQAWSAFGAAGLAADVGAERRVAKAAANAAPVALTRSVAIETPPGAAVAPSTVAATGSTAVAPAPVKRRSSAKAPAAVAPAAGGPLDLAQFRRAELKAPGERTPTARSTAR